MNALDLAVSELSIAWDLVDRLPVAEIPQYAVWDRSFDRWLEATILNEEGRQKYYKASQ